MSEIAPLIQRQLPLGSKVEILLKSGDKITGILHEISMIHLTLLNTSGNASSYLIDMIGGWQLIDPHGANGTAQPEETIKEPPHNVQAPQTEAAAPYEQAQRQLAEIDAFFDSRVQVAHHEIKPPGLQAPLEEFKEYHNYRELLSKWDSISQRYRHAINHDTGRLPEIIAGLKNLLHTNPSVLTIKRILPYFQYQAGKVSDALTSYKELCLQTQAADDWYNLSVLALKTGNTTLACYALEQAFIHSSLQRNAPEWYIYTKIIQASGQYFLFKRLYTFFNNLQEDEQRLFLETCIYILNKRGDKDAALQLVQQLQRKKAIHPLIVSALAHFDAGQRDPYREVLPELVTIQQRLTRNQNSQAANPNSNHTVRRAVPHRDTGLYEQARKIITTGQDQEQAIPLLEKAIEKRENAEASIRQLVSLYFRMNRQEEIILLLKKYGHLAPRSIDNSLTEAYWQTKQYKETIEPLTRAIKNLPTNAPQSKRVYMYQQMGYCYIKTEQYDKAKEWFENIIQMREDHIVARKYIAVCLIKQGQFDEAEQILQKLPPDAKATELLDEIQQARNTGQSAQVDTIINNLTITRVEGTFAQFFLERCKYEGVPPDRVSTENFKRNDIYLLTDLAFTAGPRLPQERSKFYLSAAKIMFTRGLEWANSDQAYHYLCLSFTSRGDDAILNNKPLDTACEWYSEALRVYGGDKTRGDQEGAKFALARFIYASAGERQDIPMGQNPPAISEALNYLAKHPDFQKFFLTITYLISRSEYAADILLDILYKDPALQKKSLQYLVGEKLPLSHNTITREGFKALWEQRSSERLLTNIRTIHTQLLSISKIELTNLSSVEDCLQQVKEIEQKAHWPLDQQRLKRFKKIMEDIKNLCMQQTFEGKDRLCDLIDINCQTLLKEIEDAPTLLSIEIIHALLVNIQSQTKNRRQEIRENFKPKLTLRIPTDMEAQTPVDRQIEIQIVIANEFGCSPADMPELIFKENARFFELKTKEAVFEGSLRGGDSQPLPIQLILTDEAIQEETFSLSAHVQYHTYSGETCTTEPRDFTIALGSPEDFQHIRNPYQAYAHGAKVAQHSMFYGRNRFIDEVIAAIDEAGLQSKSYAIYGQMRSGKSSILHHLMEKLRRNPDLLIVDIISMGIYNDNGKSTAFEQILWTIFEATRRTIKNKINNGHPPLAIIFPEHASDFYNHPAPQHYFIELFQAFMQTTSQTSGWQKIKVIICIDEFQYIYDYIVKGRLTEHFMHYWKAILQINLFSTILVGQDVMPKFIRKFSNDFGVIEKFRVTYLEEEYARKLIEIPILFKGERSRFKENAAEYIIHLTAGNPYYIQIICNRLVHYMNQKKRPFITEADVKNVTKELVGGIQRLETEFDNLTTSGDTSTDAISQTDAEMVLEAIAQNSGDGFCRRDDIKCATLSKMDDILQDLVLREVLDKDARVEQYRIKVELYKEWLLENR